MGFIVVCGWLESLVTWVIDEDGLVSDVWCMVGGGWLGLDLTLMGMVMGLISGVFWMVTCLGADVASLLTFLGRLSMLI